MEYTDTIMKIGAGVGGYIGANFLEDEINAMMADTAQSGITDYGAGFGSIVAGVLITQKFKQKYVEYFGFGMMISGAMTLLKSYRELQTTENEIDNYLVV